MSTLKDPVGPKSRKVYMRRRLLVLAGLVAVIVVVVLTIVKPGSNEGAQSARDIELPSDLAGSTATEDEPEDDPDAIPTCAKGALEVTPATDRTDYAADELPQLSLTVSNTGEEACSADLGTAGMAFTVSSGSDEVWRSADCQEDPEHLAVILDPGEELTTEAVEWDRTRSSTETCDISRDEVAAGGASYHLRVEAAGVSGSGTAQFLLY